MSFEGFNQTNVDNADMNLSPEMAELIDRYRAAGMKLDVMNVETLESTGLNAAEIINTVELAQSEGNTEAADSMTSKVSLILADNVDAKRKRELAGELQKEVNAY